MEKYADYFNKTSEEWSLPDFASYVLKNFEAYDAKTVHKAFYNILNKMILKEFPLEDIVNWAKSLIKSKPVSIFNSSCH